MFGRVKQVRGKIPITMSKGYENPPVAMATVGRAPGFASVSNCGANDAPVYRSNASINRNSAPGLILI